MHTYIHRYIYTYIYMYIHRGTYIHNQQYWKKCGSLARPAGPVAPKKGEGIAFLHTYSSGRWILHCHHPRSSRCAGTPIVETEL